MFRLYLRTEDSPARPTFVVQPPVDWSRRPRIAGRRGQQNLTSARRKQTGSSSHDARIHLPAGGDLLGYVRSDISRSSAFWRIPPFREAAVRQFRSGGSARGVVRGVVEEGEAGVGRVAEIQDIQRRRALVE